MGKKKYKKVPNPQKHENILAPKSNNSNHKNISNYPQSFPHSASLPIPAEGKFLENEGRYKKTYSKALETSYEGFTCDIVSNDKEPSLDDLFEHDRIRQALKCMEECGYFRTDVTQPFGLGTKCAKTYVSRCLLGEEGTTYKYLGLRMFASPWNGRFAKDDDDDGNSNKSKSVKEALLTISQLNARLTQRTEGHLQALNDRRRERGVSPGVRGRCLFDLTLINRMEYAPELKAEPMTGEGRCTVSWHADSCLENYSSIGVYHTIFHDHSSGGGGDAAESCWTVPLRVAHDSEGPSAGQPCVVTETPVLSTNLPSGSAYYLLDDFNHHHQHAVLAPPDSNGGIRFSSTHRLLRQGHNVHFILERCKSITSNFHKKGPKLWRSEQLLLSDIESDWIRQFYIQGEGHKLNLWLYWKAPICALLNYWTKLESRVKNVIDLFQLAAEDRCMTSDDLPNSREERKLREKRKKAGITISDIINRGSDTTHENACDTLFEPMALLLEQRAKMRHLWHERQKDAVFTSLPQEYQPLEPPFLFQHNPQNTSSTQTDFIHQEEIGKSPLVGKPHQMNHLISDLRQWGKAYQSSNPSHLPKLFIHPSSSSNDTHSNHDDHAKTLTWNGWSNNNRHVSLEMQDPWAKLLLSGQKKMETRAYDLPSSLLGRKIIISQSKPGKAGISSLPNIITQDKDGIDNYVQLVGWVIFNKVIVYQDEKSFIRDESLHLVKQDTGYGWTQGKTNRIFGWVVSSKGFYSTKQEKPQVTALIRRMRSLYEIQMKMVECNPNNENKKPSKFVKDARKKKHGKRKEGVISKFPGSGDVSKKNKKRRY